MSARTPLLVTVYGLLGVVPFWAPPALALAAPSMAPEAASVLSLYGALILSFLGGARWGMTVDRPQPSPAVISLAMLPTLVALALELVPSSPWRLVGLAVALGLHWVWDLRSPGLPAWYPTLRSGLTAGAVVGLLAGAAVLP